MTFRDNKLVFSGEYIENATDYYVYDFIEGTPFEDIVPNQEILGNSIFLSWRTNNCIFEIQCLNLQPNTPLFKLYVRAVSYYVE